MLESEKPRIYKGLIVLVHRTFNVGVAGPIPASPTIEAPCMVNCADAILRQWLSRLHFIVAITVFR